MRQHRFLYTFTLLLFCLHLISSEFFTSIAELEKLLLTKDKVVNNLQGYLKFEAERLEKVKWFRKQYEILHSAAKNKSEEFLSNPVNAYLLIKRLTTDWDAASSLLVNNPSEDLFKRLSSPELFFPSNDDLVGAKEALLRLQEIYLLDTDILAEGKIKGSSSSGKLTAADCLDFAHSVYWEAKFQRSLEWTQEASKRFYLEQKENLQTTSITEILQHMAFSLHYLKNNTGAAELMEEILRLNPNDADSKENLQYFRSLGDEYENQSADEVSNTGVYERLCRGESLKTPKEESQLYCFYTNNNRSYLLLQPAKVEILNWKTQVVVFHDVLRDWEINMLKALALPKLERAMVNNYDTGKGKPASYRISKRAWITYYDHYLIGRINKRLEDITSLDTSYAESLQVMNYGIGGHFRPHYDHVKPGENVNFLAHGNRIATLIFYLSDVMAGGQTVFLDLGVEVKPVKGSAVFWYNMYRNGNGNDDTRHAACPVLTGSKWVATVWFHEFGNELGRPCTLNPLE